MSEVFDVYCNGYWLGEIGSNADLIALLTKHLDRPFHSIQLDYSTLTFIEDTGQ